MFAGEELKTGHGRAEVLLWPGVIVRIDSGSSFRLLSNGQTGFPIEFLSGSLIVEALRNQEEPGVTVSYGGTLVHLTKAGLYRFDSKAGTLRVFTGSATVESAGRKIEISNARILPLDARLTPAKSKDNAADSFDQWSWRRTALMHRANWELWLSARKTKVPLRGSGWVSSPNYHVLTYVPAKGVRCSAYGYGFLNGNGWLSGGGVCASYFKGQESPDAPDYLKSDRSLYPNPGTGTYPTRVPSEGTPIPPFPVTR